MQIFITFAFYFIGDSEMACYSVPLAAAVILYAARKISHKESHSLKLLNLMLAGGAVMLVIDHYWNGELFLLGENLAMDLLLGVAMTLGAVLFWGIAVAFKAKELKTIQPTNNKG